MQRTIERESDGECVPEGHSSTRKGAKQGQRSVLTGDGTVTVSRPRGHVGKPLPQSTVMFPWNLQGGMTLQRLPGFIALFQVPITP